MLITINDTGFTLKYILSLIIAILFGLNVEYIKIIAPQKNMLTIYVITMFLIRDKKLIYLNAAKHMTVAQTSLIIKEMTVACSFINTVSEKNEQIRDEIIILIVLASICKNFFVIIRIQ